MTTPSLTNPNPKREGIDHEFKSHPDVFWPAARGEKTFEFRKDDRGGYQVGQTVRLRCFDSDRLYHPVEPLDRVITNILRPGEFGLQDGYCILSLASARPSPGDPVRTALAPFVAHYQPWMDDWADDDPCGAYARVTFGDLRRARAVLSAAPTPALHDDERDLTDEDRIAYWKGAYDRMAARNGDLSRQIASLGEPSNPLLAQILDAFHSAQDEVKEHLFHNSIYLFDALTRARHAMTKQNPMIEEGRERAKRCSSEHCKDGYCMNWHAPHACWIKPGPYVADEHGTPITGLSWCAAQPHEKNTSHCPACGVGPLEACRGRVPQDDEAKS